MNIKLLYRTLIVLVIILLIIGSALVLSASSVISYVLFKSFYNLFIAHITKVILAVFALVFFTFFPYEYYKQYTKKAIFGIVALLLLTLAIAPNLKGAGRWIHLGFFSFQPSEIAKLILLMHIAFLVETKGDEIKDFKEGFIYPVIWILIIAGLVFIQPNVSTSLIIMIVSFTVLFVSGAKFIHISSTLVVTGTFAGIFMMLFSHSRERILTFINSFGNGGHINIQVTQAKIALGSGGLFGIGMGQSRQSDLFLPEAYGDFIFSILGEELGFIGTAGVLLVYVMIFLIGIIIAKNAADKFAQSLAFGISFMIIISAFINAAVVTGIFPTTGIPLPFISYGGTNILFTCAAAGILVNIGMKTNKLKFESLAKANAFKKK